MPGFPLWVIVLDYLLGVVMWTLIGRFAMGLFLAPDSSFFFMRFFVRVSDLFMRWFAPVTPGGFWSPDWCRSVSPGSSLWRAFT